VKNACHRPPSPSRIRDNDAPSDSGTTHLEKSEALHQRTGIAIREALEDAGVVFIDENGGGAGVRFRKAMPK
jgi:hypothetical protein